MDVNHPELGCCYYPEHWPEGQWDDDARRMVEAGLSWVRIGEFSWSRLEPKEGDYSWAWLDKAVDVLGRAGLKIVLGTPSATPPKWIVNKHPDMLAVDANNQQRNFGSRRHYCFSHEGYIEEAVRIALAMGERYGSNPYIKAWQIDNEYGCHDTVISYSPMACEAFRLWLKEKYMTIEGLNEAWGNVFWSMEYTCFNDVDLPNLTVTEVNPSHAMDFRRFSSSQVVKFNRAQCDALKSVSKAPLIHNYMGRILEFDHFDLGQDLEIASWDSYPLGFLEDRSDQNEDWKKKFSRQGDPDFQAFHHDLYRAVGKGCWWVMEQQPGPVNWAPYNPAPLTGMVRLWTWEAIAHGAEVVSYFRWRQAPFAQEQMHAGLLRPDNVESATFKEITQTASEISELKETLSGQTEISQIGIVFDYQSAWAWETQPQGQSFDYFKLVFDFYRSLRRLGLSIDILPPKTENFEAYKLVIIPGLMHWNESLTKALKSFTGKSLIGPRTGSKTPNFTIPANMPPNIEGFEAIVSSVETLRPDSSVKLEGTGSFQNWREFVETDLPVTLETRDGHPALITSNNKSYLAGWPNEVAMANILKSLLSELNIKTIDLPSGLRCRDMGSHRLYINYSTETAKIMGYKIQPANILLVNRKTNEILLDNKL